MKLGFIGFGEAAYEMTSGFRQEGPVEIVAYDAQWNHPAYGSLIRDRAAKTQVRLVEHPRQVLESGIRVVIVAVPANRAIEASESAKPYLSGNCLYVDVTASSPDVKRQIHDSIRDTGTPFVDAAMMGPLSVFRHKVPILASGDGTDAFISLMAPLGMRIEKISDTAGDASGVKLVRSIFMKGIAALFIEMLEAAHKFRIADIVIKSIGETMDATNFETTLNRMVTGTAIHAERRFVELEGTLALLEGEQLEPILSYAIRDKLKKIADLNLRQKFQGKAPDHWQDVIREIRNGQTGGMEP